MIYWSKFLKPSEVAYVQRHREWIGALKAAFGEDIFIASENGRIYGTDGRCFQRRMYL